jgi:lysophospholipase L1-like esterase
VEVSWEDKIPIPIVSNIEPAIIPIPRSEQWWIDRHMEKQNDMEKNNKIIFIGDSLTQYWEGTEAWIGLNKKYCNKIMNLGFRSDFTQHVLWRLENGEFPDGTNPEYVVIMIGINNTTQTNNPESIAAGIGEIVKVVNIKSPLTKILLFSLLPHRITDWNNTSIEVNEIISKYNNYLQVQYIDLRQYFIDNNGQMLDNLFSDNVHLTEDGYTIWKEKLEEIIDCDFSET